MRQLPRVARLAAKLRGRSAAELRERGAQALAARLERAGVRDAGEPSDAAFVRRLTSDARRRGADPITAWLDEFRTRPATRFFASFEDPSRTIAAVCALDAGREAELRARADAALAGRFALLGHPPLDFGTPVDWMRDPIAGMRAPDAHWSRIPYLDARVAGDHKLVWELNRHQFLPTLGQAYWLTGDERYARGCVAMWTSWMDANPPKRGVNWASSLEVSYRAISWLWALWFIRRSSALTPALFTRLVKHLDVHARHLERYLSTYFSPNTHLTGEALGLLYLGTQLPELARAPEWRERGWAVLHEQLARHVRPDGVYFEQATYYHRYTVDIYLHARLLAERAGLAGVDAADAALVRLLDHIVHLARPDGTIPLTGDEDGGRLVMLDGELPDDVRPPLSTGAILFGRSDYAYAAGRVAEESVWLLGPEAPRAFARVEKRAPDELSRAFPDGGVFVMRDGWGRDASQLVIDCGPHGVDNHGHAHADALALELTVRGRPVLVDPGTYTYTTEPALRDQFRSSLVHNTLSIDGVSSSVPSGPFSWEHVAECVQHAWQTFAPVDYFEGSHDGYARLPAPAVHRRAVLHVRGEYWIVRDAIESRGAHEVMLTFQCAPGIGAALHDPATVELRGDAGAILSLSTFAPRGRVAIDTGAVSRRYGQVDPAPRCRVLCSTSGTEHLTTVLLPGAARDGEVRRRATARGEAFEIDRSGSIDLVLFDVGGTEVDGITTDARVAWVRRDRRDGRVLGLVMLEGSTLAVEGVAMLGARGRTGSGCASRVEEEWRLEGEVALAAELGSAASLPLSPAG